MQLSWRPPFTPQGKLEGYLVRIEDSVGVIRELSVRAKINKINIKWMEETMRYQAEVVALIHGQPSQTSATVTLKLGCSVSTSPSASTYKDQFNRDCLVTPRNGLLYEFFGAQEVATFSLLISLMSVSHNLARNLIVFTHVCKL